MEDIFPTEYKKILQKIALTDPVQYGISRNYTNGAVTYLSPYLSRGVISTRQVFNSILGRGFSRSQIESLVKELCWRDYFQRVAQVRDVNRDIRHKQEPVLTDAIPVSVLNAATGIEGIDTAIEKLYRTGYMHNHCRMYTASIVCNLAKSYWHNGARWMYYHLLDGDWASNACSWQWVAGANSEKKYYANQENINKYTFSSQTNTFLDTSYEALMTMETPAVLSETQKFAPEHNLPETDPMTLDVSKPSYIYNYYNLDPLWHKDEPGNRILLLDPGFFNQYPVSKKCMDFLLALSKNIAGIQVYKGSFQSLVDTYALREIYFKEHPLNFGYSGTEEPRDWLATNVTGYYRSFFSYWKEVQQQLFKSV